MCGLHQCCGFAGMVKHVPQHDGVIMLRHTIPQPLPGRYPGNTG